jgi:hypothetical protein
LAADEVGDRPLPPFLEIVHAHEYARTCINMQYGE